LPVLIVLSAILVANLSWFLARAAGMPQWLGGGTAVVCLLAGVALAIGSSVGTQGTVRVHRGELEVDARWRSVRRLPLSDAQVTPMIWRRGFVELVVGVVLEIRGRTGSVSIGASDPALADALARQGVERTTVPPSFRIASEDLRRLLETLGIRSDPDGAF
jgi:hypothetical protein